MTNRTTGAAKVAPRRSGPSLTEERRRELGFGTIKLRLPLDVLEMLSAKADRDGSSRAEVVDAAVRRYCVATS